MFTCQPTSTHSAFNCLLLNFIFFCSENITAMRSPSVLFMGFFFNVLTFCRGGKGEHGQPQQQQKTPHWKLAFITHNKPGAEVSTGPAWAQCFVKYFHGNGYYIHSEKKKRKFTNWPNISRGVFSAAMLTGGLSQQALGALPRNSGILCGWTSVPVSMCPAEEESNDFRLNIWLLYWSYLVPSP